MSGKDFQYYSAIFEHDEAVGRVRVTLYRDQDNSDVIEIARTFFGPFDTTKNITDWLCGKLSPALKLPLR
jgi:hypothetical protein